MDPFSKPTAKYSLFIFKDVIEPYSGLPLINLQLLLLSITNILDKFPPIAIQYWLTEILLTCPIYFTFLLKTKSLTANKSSKLRI